MTPSPMPPPGQDLYDLGLRLLEGGQPQAAVERLEAARRLNPGDPALLYALGNGLRLCGRPEEAAEALKASLSLQPEHADAAFSLAFLYIQQAETARAADLLLTLCSNRPAEDGFREKAAALLAGAGENASAAELYEQAAQHAPGRAGLHLQLGIQYQKIGLYEEAAKAFRRAIDLNPRLGPAYMLFAHTRRFTEVDAELEQRSQASLGRPDLGAEDAACIHFALGKMYDDGARYDAAFGHYRSGNELRHRQTAFDRQGWQEYVGRQLRVFEKLPLPAPRPADFTPAFIVGMPRSGTTLVSRLLSNDPSVFNLGETELLEAFVQRVVEIKNAPYPECILELQEGELEAIASDYRRQMPKRGPGTRFVVDKNPLNFVYLGLIGLLFPEAPIVHCRRDALDTCLSIYFQNFAHPRIDFAYAFEDIAAYYAGYERLMAFWEKRLPGNIATVKYEGLVAAPEEVMKPLYATFGLAWDAQAIRAEANPANIATASLWQARQPVYTHAAGRWRNFEKHLQPLQNALDRYRAEYP